MNALMLEDIKQLVEKKPELFNDVVKALPAKTADRENGTSGRGLSKAFILAGAAIFTVGNPEGERHTFRVTKKEKRNSGTSARTGEDIYFISYLSGPENVSDYTYMGVVLQNAGTAQETIKLTRASRVNDSTKMLRVAQWLLGLIWKGETVPAGYYLNHAGRCGRSGRLLTVPESIETGFGPECAGRLGLS